MTKKQSQPSKDAEKQQKVLALIQQPPTEALPKEQTNSAENEENKDRLLNTGVIVESTDFSHLLEEMPLNELNTPLQVPEPIGRASIIIGDGF